MTTLLAQQPRDDREQFTEHFLELQVYIVVMGPPVQLVV